jgi:hypothetical protein
MEYQVEYLADSSVDDAMDAALRSLFVTCFTKPCDDVFRHRRFWREPYPHRWIVRGGDGGPIAHVGAHDKRVEAGSTAYRIGGICEVCVHPSSRGLGLVRQMLRVVHAWLQEQGYDFALLFGKPEVYRSSGYRPTDNLFLDLEDDSGQRARRLVAGMFRPLSDTPWPACEVFLPGPKF